METEISNEKFELHMCARCISHLSFRHCLSDFSFQFSKKTTNFISQASGVMCAMCNETSDKFTLSSYFAVVYYKENYPKEYVLEIATISQLCSAGRCDLCVCFHLHSYRASFSFDVALAL